MIVYEVVAWEPYEPDMSYGFYLYEEDAKRRLYRLVANDGHYNEYGGYDIQEVYICNRERGSDGTHS